MATVETMTALEVAKALHTTESKVKYGIKSGQLPIGFVVEKPGALRERVIIVKERWEKWCSGEITGTPLIDTTQQVN